MNAPATRTFVATASPNYALIAAVREALRTAADWTRAPAMQAYMKSDMPYYGVPMPELRRVCRAVFAAHPLNGVAEFESTVYALFVDADHREERYAAVFLARQRTATVFQTPARLPLYREMIVAGEWWDTVDEIASHLVGPLLLADPAAVRPVLVDWISDDNLWIRRTVIIAQLQARGRADLELLTAAIDANASDRDFFIRKAIGWSLREYAKTDAGWVRAFVDARESTLSGLSKREARKHL